MEIFWFVLLAFVGGLGGLLVFVYYLKRGQFEDPEDPKYTLFREKDDAKISQ
jgi:cbb3-type cytochrome oxidase maturation protein